MTRRRGPAALSLAAGLALLGGCAARARTGPPPAPPGASPAPSAADDGAPVIREIVLEGITAFDGARVSRAIRLHEGSRLRRDPSVVAGDLRLRYLLSGYPAARVTAAFDPARGRLRLTADEGRVEEVAVEGVEGRAAERARELLAVPTGRPLRDEDLRAGLRRLNDVSGGALHTGEPEYVIDPLDEGVRLRVHVVRERMRLRLRPRGPDLSPLQNRVEGTAPGAGAELLLLDPVSFHHASVYARGSYGSGSDGARFALGARRPFGAGGRLVLGYEFHDLTDTDDHFRRQLVEEPAGRPLVFSIFEDYFRRRGHEAYAFLRPSPRLQLGVSWRSDRHLTLPVVADDRLSFVARRPRPNPMAADALVRSVLVTARWSARGALYPDETAERESFLVRTPYGDRFRADQGVRVDATWELAGHGLGGASDFQRFIAHARTTRSLGARSSVNARALLGLTGGEPPPERRFALGGQGTLRGYAAKEFRGDRMALTTLEWTYQPPPRWPGLVAFYDGGVAWTSGLTGARWRDDVGIGLAWPGGGRARGWVRVDLGYALRPEPGRTRTRVHALVRLPF